MNSIILTFLGIVISRARELNVSINGALGGAPIASLTFTDDGVNFSVENTLGNVPMSSSTLGE